MTVVAGPLVRIEPAKAASTPGVFTPLLEVIAPATSVQSVATVTASALSGTEPAMGTVRVWNRTISGYEQVRIYGTQTVTMVMLGVTAGDLIQIAAEPYFYDGEWESARVWVHSAELTLVDYDDIPASDPTYAPSLPPTQIAVSDLGGGSTSMTYSFGEAWGPFPTETLWRFRPVGGDVWQVHTASNSIPVALPFDLSAAADGWEVQAAQTTIGGTSPWGETSVWTASDDIVTGTVAVTTGAATSTASGTVGAVPPTYISSSTPIAAFGNTPVNITLPTVLDDDLIIIAVSASGANNTGAATAPGFTTAHYFTTTNEFRPDLTLLQKVAVAASDSGATVAVTPNNASSWSAGAMVVRGATAIRSTPTPTTVEGGTIAQDPAAITPAAASDMVGVFIGYHNSTAEAGQISGFTRAYQNGDTEAKGQAMFYLQNAGTGSVNPPATNQSPLATAHSIITFTVGGVEVPVASDPIAPADILLDATIDDDPDLWEYFTGGNKQLQTNGTISNQGSIPVSVTAGDGVRRFNVAETGVTGANTNAILFRVDKDDPDTAGTDAKRTEVNYVGFPAIGAEVWWAWRMMIPAQYWGYTDNRIMACQLKDGFGTGAFSQPYFSYYVEPTGCNWVLQAASQTTRKVAWNYVPGQWYDIVVQYKRSETGFLRMWIDGEPVISTWENLKVAAPSTGNDATAGHKHGTYHWVNAGNTWDVAQGDTNTIYYEKIVAATGSYTAADLRNHLKFHTGRG